MFLKCLIVALFISGMVAAEATNPKAFLMESAKRLDALVKKKEKNLKDPLTIGDTFDDFAGDTKELLDVLDKQSSEDQKSEKKQEIIQMIACNMGAMEKLLNLMNCPEPEPLRDYCQRTSEDPAWVAICNRPAKQVSQREIMELKKKRLEEESDTRAAKRRKMINDSSQLQDEEQR